MGGDMIFSTIETIQAETATPMADLCDIIQAVGTDAFDTRLGRLLAARFALGEALVFCHTPGTGKTPVLLAVAGDAEAQARAAGYCSALYRDDPLFDVLGEDTPDGFYALRLTADQARNPRFRSLFFARPGFGERLVIARKAGQKLIALTACVVREAAPYDNAGFSELSRLGTLLLPLLSLHGRLFTEENRFRRVSPAEMEDCVSWAFPALTQREVSVCARSILGVTAEGIALDLGIKQTSVLTYRRRAYARLNVNSINQLSTMLIQSSAARKMAMAS